MKEWPCRIGTHYQHLRRHYDLVTAFALQFDEEALRSGHAHRLGWRCRVEWAGRRCGTGQETVGGYTPAAEVVVGVVVVVVVEHCNGDGDSSHRHGA